MNVSALEWGITLSVTIAILLFDVIVIGRRPHEPSRRETGTALTIGLIWLAIGFVWLLVVTRGFRRPTPVLDLEETA